MNFKTSSISITMFVMVSMLLINISFGCISDHKQASDKKSDIVVVKNKCLQRLDKINACLKNKLNGRLNEIKNLEDEILEFEAKKNEIAENQKNLENARKKKDLVSGDIEEMQKKINDWLNHMNVDEDCQFKDFN